MWTIFKVFIGFVMIPLLFHVLVLWTQGMLYVSSLTRTEPTLPALEGKVPTTGWSEKVAPFSTIALWLCQFRFHHSSYLITLMPPKGSNFCHSPLQFTLQTVARWSFLISCKGSPLIEDEKPSFLGRTQKAHDFPVLLQPYLLPHPYRYLMI